MLKEFKILGPNNTNSDTSSVTGSTVSNNLAHRVKLPQVGKVQVGSGAGFQLKKRFLPPTSSTSNMSQTDKASEFGASTTQKMNESMSSMNTMKKSVSQSNLP